MLGQDVAGRSECGYVPHGVWWTMMKLAKQVNATRRKSGRLNIRFYVSYICIMLLIYSYIYRYMYMMWPRI